MEVKPDDRGERRDGAVYSHSKIKSFEKCALQFRYRYVDHLAPEVESIESFAGRRVHEVLEALYRALEAEPDRLPGLDELQELYRDAWDAAWHERLEIAREGYRTEDYWRLGARCLTTFYRGNWPFQSDRTLAIEAEISFVVGGGGAGGAGSLIRGFADRIAAGPAGELLIHDYKTSTYLPRRDQTLADLQLAIYQLGAAERWPGEREVKLVWHFLAFGRRITVRLDREGLEAKQREVARRIGSIERAVEADHLPARVSTLCRWCGYRPRCPDYAAERPAGAAAIQPAAPLPERVPVALPGPGLRLKATPRARFGAAGARTAADSPQLDLL